MSADPLLASFETSLMVDPQQCSHRVGGLQDFLLLRVLSVDDLANESALLYLKADASH